MNCRRGILASDLVCVELVALLVGHDGDADADEHGRNHQDEDAAPERVNQARAGAGRLGVAKRAALREEKVGCGEQQHQDEKPAKRTQREPARMAHLAAIHSASIRVCGRAVNALLPRAEWFPCRLI